MTSFEEFSEAEKLLEKVASWSDEDIQQLPVFYQEKAREYQKLMQQGEE